MKAKQALLSLLILGLLCGAVWAQGHSEIKTTSQGHPLQCQPSQAESTENQNVFQQLNAYRQSVGANALAYDAALEQCIEAHCHHMDVHNFFAHQGPAGEAETVDPWTRASNCGTSAAGENIARGQPSATAVMNAWKNSPGHDANMRNNNFTRVGVGYWKNNGPFWGQLFGTGAVTQPPQNQPPAQNPPPAGGGGGGGTPPPSGGGGGTTPAPDPNAGLQPSAAGPTSDPYGANAPPPNTSSINREKPPEKKIVQPGLLKRK